MFIVKHQWIYFSAAFGLCDPFLISHFPEQGCPYSNVRPLPLILPGHFYFIIYPKAYLLFSLNEVVSAFTRFLHLLPPTIMKTSVFPSTQVVPMSSEEKDKEMALGQTKVCSEVSP